MKRLMASVLSLFLLLGFACGTATAEEISTEPGFDSPEDAVRNYLYGLQKMDLDQMLDSFGFETQAAHIHFDKTLERTGAYVHTSIPAFPDGTAFFDSINAELAKQNIVRQIGLSVLSYLYPETDVLNPIRIGEKSETFKTPDDFISTVFDTSRLEQLATLDNIEIYEPQALISLGILNQRYLEERIQNNIETQRQIYGADELSDRIAVFTIGGEHYAFAPSVARFGNRWYVYSVLGYAGISLNIDMANAAFFNVEQLGLW